MDFPKKIVIFASGAGSNAIAIIRHFEQNRKAGVVAVFSNNPQAAVLDRAKAYAVDTVVFSRDEFRDGSVLKKIRSFEPDLIVLAGFLWLFPSDIVKEYSGRIVNIHPALLPSYGGKGMYGMNVHRAVKQNSESETGITIHYVDDHYDEGDVIFQISIKLSGDETPEQIADRVQKLEHEHYPLVIEKLLK